MSWSYSGNPSASSLDEVRFLITDTVQSKSYTLQNEEINYALKLYSDDPPVVGQNFQAAAICCDVILGKLKSLSGSKSVGDLHVDFSAGLKFFGEAAYRLRQKASLQKISVYCGGLSRAEKAAQNANPDRIAPAAKIDGMNTVTTFDNNADPNIEP